LTVTETKVYVLPHSNPVNILLKGLEETPVVRCHLLLMIS
jgi:hypothetical protein